MGNRGASSQKSGAGAGAKGDTKENQKQNALNSLNALSKSSSLKEKQKAINAAIDAGVEKGIIAETTKQFPKGTVLYVQEASPMGYSVKYYTKTGAAGKDGWRDEAFEKVDTSSFMLYKNGGAKAIVDVRKKG